MVNIIAIFVMIIAIMVTIIFSNQQIKENKKSTAAQIEKMQDQIKAIKNVTPDYIAKTEELKKQNRMKEFKASLEVLDMELEHNLSKLKKIRNNIDNGFTYHSLNYSLIVLLLYKPSTVEFGGETLYQSLLSVRGRIESFSSSYSRLEALYVQRGLSPNEIEQIQDIINQTKYIIVLCRSLIQKYRQDGASLLKKESYDYLAKALALENTYRKADQKTAYKKLYEELKEDLKSIPRR